MSSTLIVTNVDKVFRETAKIVKNTDKCSIYLTLSKSWAKSESQIKKYGVKNKKIIFIDLISDKKGSEKKAIFLKPNDLKNIMSAIAIIANKIDGDKQIIIDSLVTLLIYNNQNKVADFIKSLNQFASNNKINLFAISQKTKEEDLLNKVYNFFDEVLRK